MNEHKILLYANKKEQFSAFIELIKEITLNTSYSYQKKPSEEDINAADVVFIIPEANEEKIQGFSEITSVVSVGNALPTSKIEALLNAGALQHLDQAKLDATTLHQTVLMAAKNTDRIRAQKRIITDFENQQQNLSRAISEAIYEWDLANNRINWLSSPLNQLGYREENLNSIQKYAHNVHSDDVEKFTQHVRDIFSGQREENKIDITYTFVKGNGNKITICDRAVIIRDSNNKPVRIVGAIEDATIRLQAEEKIKTSEKKYSLLFYKSPVAKFIYQVSDLAILDANEAAIDQYGYSHNELTHMKLDGLFAKDNLFPYLKVAGNFTPDTKPMKTGHWHHLRKDGSPIYVEIIGYSLLIDGKSHVIISCNDVTEKQHATQKLEELTERYHYVHQAIKDVIWDYDVETSTFTRSENFLKIFGYDESKLSNSLDFWQKHIHPDDRERVIKSFKHALQVEDEQWSYEYRFARKNGEYAYVEDEAIILRDEIDRPYRVIGSFRDVTERYQNEQELKLMSSVITNSNDAVLITEAANLDEPGPKILFANESFYKQSGYTADEIIGQSPRILQGPKTRSKELKTIRKALENKEPCTVELINYTKSNQEFCVEISIDPVFNNQGECTHFISIQRDITERKTIESEDSLFQRIYASASHVDSMRKRFEVIIRMLAKAYGFNMAEGWLTSIDSNELLKIAEYASTKKNGSFFNESTFYDTTRIGEGLPGICSEQKDIIIWNDLPSNDLFIRKEVAQLYQLKSALAIPVFAHDTLIGCLLFFKKQGPIKPIDKSSSLYKICQRLGPELKRMKIESEQNTFFNLSPAVLCIANRRGYFVKVNHAFSAITEYSEEELKAKPFLRFVHPADKAKTIAKLENIVYNKDTNTYFENRYITKSDGVRWLAWSHVNLVDEQLIYAVANDITEKKSLERTLEKTNQLAHIGQWEIALDSDLMYWSPVLRDLFEVPEDFEPSLNRFMDFFSDEKSNVNKLISAYKKGKKTATSLESSIISAKNNEKWVSVWVEGEYIDHHCVRLYGSVQDISSRKKTQLQLEKAYQEKEDIITSITDGFMALDYDWKVRYWNPAAEEIFDMPGEKILHKNLWETFPRAKELKLYSEYAKAIKSQAVRKFEEYYEAKDLWFEVSVYPSDLGLTIYFRDITKRKKQEEELVNIKNLQFHVINSTTDFIWAIDTDYTLILANNAYLDAMKKYSGQHYKIGQSVMSVLKKEWKLGQKQKEKLIENYKKAMTNETVVFVLTIEPGKQRIQHQIAMHPIISEDKVTGVACFSRDITERNEHIEAIEDQNKRLTEIAWLQSHAVRAPVARIMGLINLLKINEGDTQTLLDLADKIYNSASELDQIIQDISDRTKIVEGLKK